MTTIPTIPASRLAWTGKAGAAEASDLGFRAGQLPRDILVKGRDRTVRFEAHRQEVRDGDLVSTTYLAVVDGHFVKVVIFND